MFCNKCGKELKEGALFCDKCGKKVKSNNGTTKSNKLPFIIISIIVVIAVIIGFIIINKDNTSKEMNTNIPSGINASKELIREDSTAPRGVTYNFKLEDVKRAMDSACKENNTNNYLDFEYSRSQNNVDFYTSYKDETKNYGCLMEVMVYNDYVIGVSFSFYDDMIEELNQNGYNVLFNILKDNYNADYSSRIKSIIQDLDNEKYEYYNNTICYKERQDNFGTTIYSITASSLESYNELEGASSNSPSGINTEYTQSDEKVWIGRSFKNVDFKTFKENVIKLWFAGQLEYDNIKAYDEAMYGKDYGKWLDFVGNDGYPYEEIKTIFTKSGNISGPWIPSKMIDIYYNNDKTAVFGFTIYISDAYLGKMGRSNLTSMFVEVLDCLPEGFKEVVKSRAYDDTEYDDFNVNVGTITLNNENFNILTCYCEASKMDSSTNVNSNINADNSKILNNKNNSSNSNNSLKDTVEVQYFTMGYELQEYTSKLDNLGISYKIVKGQDLNYSNNTVISVEHNGEKIEKGTTITITVADNVYDMKVMVNTGYLLGLADLGYDYESVNLIIKINDTTICNGTFERTDTRTEMPITVGTYKGKPDNLKLDITIEGKKITKAITIATLVTGIGFSIKEKR